MTQQQIQRQCVICKSDHTRLDRYGYPTWYRLERQNKDNMMCHKCYHRIKSNPKNNQRRIRFKDKRLAPQATNPRIGECSHCHRTIASGDIKKTAMHHDLYDPNNPLANTRELCVRCHMQYHAGTLV